MFKFFEKKILSIFELVKLLVHVILSDKVQTVSYLVSIKLKFLTRRFHSASYFFNLVWLEPIRSLALETALKSPTRIVFSKFVKKS